jgi:hypothetical protein
MFSIRSLIVNELSQERPNSFKPSIRQPAFSPRCVSNMYRQLNQCTISRETLTATYSAPAPLAYLLAITTATWAYQDAHLPHFGKTVRMPQFFGFCFRVSGQVESTSRLEFPLLRIADYTSTEPRLVNAIRKDAPVVGSC